MQVYRAVVTSSSSTTGSLYVSIPSVLGTSTSIAVSAIGRAAVFGVWTVPDVGDQVVVAVEDDKFSNVFLLYPVETSIAPGSITSTELALDSVTSVKIADGSVTSVKIADANVTTAKILDGSVTNAKLGLTEVKLRRSAAQTFSLSGAYQYEEVSWDTEDADASGFITPTSDTLTVPAGASGLYLWSLRFTADYTSGANSFTVALYGVLVNSVNTYSLASFTATSTSTPVTKQESASVYLTAGDTLQFNMKIGAGSLGTGVSNGGMTATLWLTRIMD